MLNQRATGRRFEIGLRFFFHGMWRVVGGYYVDTIIEQGFPDQRAIMSGLDGGIPFDISSQSFVV